MAIVWVVLVERGVDDGADLSLFWRRAAARHAALAHVADRWPGPQDVPDDVDEAIEQYNRAVGVDERVFLAGFEIQGHEHFDGDVDDRQRCALCGEPVVLAAASDAESSNGRGERPPKRSIENGRKSRTLTSPTRSPAATRCSDDKSSSIDDD